MEPLQADIFLRRLKHDADHASNGHRPSVPILVFTDGVAGDLFNDAAKGLLEQNPHIYLTCPLQPSSPKGQMLSQFPTYKSYAFAARKIIDDITVRVDDGHIDRESVREQIEKMVKGQSDLTEFGGLKVKFDEHGNNTQGEVHIFEITRQGVVHSLLCPCAMT